MLGNCFPVLTNPSIYKVPLLAGFFCFMNRYFLFYKPYQVLSSFTSSLQKKTLASYIHVPKNVYPVGRLDEDSEGLMILTNDTTLNHRLLDPSFSHEREYWVQVEGEINNEAVSLLQQGVDINIQGNIYRTKPCRIFIFNHEPNVPERVPPIRIRKNIPTSWIKILLSEGKNRQVRKMTAKAGFPVLRLIRYRIASIDLGTLEPGKLIELSKKIIYQKLFGE